MTLDVDGHGPGAVLDRRPGDRVAVQVRVEGSGVEQLVLYGPDGVLATGTEELEHEVTVEDGLWLAAAAHGGSDPHTVGAPVFAHTTPVYVDVDGRRVARAGVGALVPPAARRPPGAGGRAGPVRSRASRSASSATWWRCLIARGASIARSLDRYRSRAYFTAIARF